MRQRGLQNTLFVLLAIVGIPRIDTFLTGVAAADVDACRFNNLWTFVFGFARIRSTLLILILKSSITQLLSHLFRLILYGQKLHRHGVHLFSLNLPY
jgi:hypothetical protein